MILKEALEKPLPYYYSGSEPYSDAVGNATHHYHEFQHDDNTYRVRHTVFEPNPWGGVHGAVSFEVKPKGSDTWTASLTPSSAPTKILGTIAEISKRMKEKHGITSFTASAAGGKEEKRNKVYKRVMERISGKPATLDMGVVRVAGLDEMLKTSVAARTKGLYESIVKRNDEYVVMNSDKTKVLGKHDTEKKAKAQLAAIEISKKKRMNEMYYRSDFTQRLKDRVKEVKAGIKNPALDINDPRDRSGAASAIHLSRQSDQNEVRTALKAIEGGSDELTSYIQTGNPVPSYLSRTDASGMEGRQNLVKKLVSYKGKV
jgi:hypothetical protein